MHFKITTIPWDQQELISVSCDVDSTLIARKNSERLNQNNCYCKINNKAKQEQQQQQQHQQQQNQTATKPKQTKKVPKITSLNFNSLKTYMLYNFNIFFSFLKDEK